MDPEFARKREEWIAMLGSSAAHQNCIYRQLFDLIHEASTFWWINESRRLAPRDKDGHPMLNGAMHHLLDKCFFTTQKIALRRQLDPLEKRPKRAVFSVRTLIDDMNSHRVLLTRSNVFGGLGVVLDSATSTKPLREGGFNSSDPREHATWAANEIAATMSRENNKWFDLLSGTTPVSRLPGDTIQQAVFDSLIARLNALDKVVVYVDKFIAHAATPFSIADKNADQVRFRFDELWHALETLWNTCQFIDCHLLRSVQTTARLIYPYDVFEHLEKPNVRSENRAELEQLWHKHQQSLEQWGTASIEWAMASVARP